MKKRRIIPNDVYSQLKLTTFEYFGKSKAIILWMVFGVVMFLLLVILVTKLFISPDMPLTNRNIPQSILPSPEVKSEKPSLQKARLVVPALPSSESSIQVFRQNMFDKNEPNKMFQLHLNDIFRLELNSQEFDQVISVPKYGIVKKLPAGKNGVLEFQANIAGQFDVFCNEKETPCSTIEVSDAPQK